MRGVELASLIGDVYDAALDPGRWADVLGDIARFVGGPSAGLYSKVVAGVVSSAASFACCSGFDVDFVESYCSEYVRLDPASNSQYFAGIGRAVATGAVIPYEEFLKTRYYREWSRPQGLVDCVNVVIDKSADGVTLLGVSRHARDGIADEAACLRLQAIAPHVRRAALINGLLDSHAARAAVLADAFDGVAAGVLLVNQAGYVVHANAAGRRILDEGDYLRLSAGRLTARDKRADRVLHTLFAVAADGDRPVGAAALALPLVAADGRRHVLHALPLGGGARRRAGSAHTAVVALFVREAALDVPSAPEIIAATYSLTPTELRVLQAIVEVGGVPDVAEALGISSETVRTHLGRLYQKTGVHRQADLVRLVAGFSNPLLR